MMKTNRLDPLDALRAFAILMVFALHAAGRTGLPNTSSTFIFFLPAWAGVWILFVLSGYLIGKGFKTKRYKNKIDFIKKRFVRICVPYYVFIFILLLLISPRLIVDDPGTLLRMITFTYDGTPGGSGRGILWFVSTLMQFYIISVFFEILVRKIEKNEHACTILFIVLLISGLILRQLLYDMEYGWNKYVYTLSLTNLDVFFCGFLLSRMIKERPAEKKGPDTQHRHRQTVFALLSIAMLLSVVVFFSYCSLAGQTAVGYRTFYMYRGQTLTILATCFYIYCLDRSVRRHNEKLSLSAVKRNPFRIVECFAAVSLGFYFWHSIILIQTASVFQPHPTMGDHLITMAAAGILTTAMAIIFYYSVEKWSVGMLRRSES